MKLDKAELYSFFVLGYIRTFSFFPIRVLQAVHYRQNTLYSQHIRMQVEGLLGQLLDSGKNIHIAHSGMVEVHLPQPTR